MPGTRDVPGSQGTMTATLPGFPEEEFTVGGPISYTPNDPRREAIEEAQGTKQQYRWMFGKGMITFPVITDKSLSILRNMVSGQLRVTYPGNGRVITLAGVTQHGDPITEDTVAGTTTEITFGFDVGTDTNAPA